MSSNYQEVRSYSKNTTYLDTGTQAIITIYVSVFCGLFQYKIV